MPTTTASAVVNCDLAKEVKLRKELRVAEADMEFAVNGCLAFLGLSLAAIAILVAVLGQEPAGKHPSAVTMAIGLLGIFTAVASGVFFRLRHWHAGRIARAEVELALHRRAATRPSAPVGVEEDVLQVRGRGRRSYVVAIVGLGLAAGLALRARS